jgi:predicted GNAT superfamily acetyltransferase
METRPVSNSAADGVREIVVRECRGPDEMQACVELQQRAWGFSDAECVPRRLFVVAQKIGGQMLGAWAGDELAGFLLALPGLRHDPAADRHQPFLHSHMLAVDSAFRNNGLGRRLKLAQREDALARGITLVEWTFDPLQPMNAHFNLANLGVVVRRYLPNHYGNSSSRLQAGVPTDRLVAEWRLGSRRVGAAAGVTLETAKTNRPIEEHIQLPAEFAAWRRQGTSGVEAMREAQAQLRNLFLDAFARGLVVTGFSREGAGGKYLLSKDSLNED